MDMGLKLNVRWSNQVRIMSSIVSAVMVVALVLLMRNNASEPINLFMILVAILIFILISYFIALAPLSIILGENELVLNRIVGKVRIDFSEIVLIEPYSSYMDLRMFGSGGFFGYTGIFRSKSIGRYTSYVGKYDQAFYVVLNSGKKYVFSCENSEIVISTITSRIKKK